jgi:predicted molibdopterin-dependent oxidoreductase YjgC
VQRVRPALEPPVGAQPDFEIIKLLARAIGADLGAETPAEAWDEMASLTPIFAGISHERLEREGAIHWPCRSPQEPGEAALYRSRFETPDGRAQLAAIDYLPPGERADSNYPIVLITGRRLEHYNSGTMTRRTPNLQLREEELVELSPADAARLGIADGDRVRVESRRGAVELAAEVSERPAEGEAFMAFHFPDALTNALTSQHTDETTTCPEYKVSAVRVSRAPE